MPERAVLLAAGGLILVLGVWWYVSANPLTVAPAVPTPQATTTVSAQKPSTKKATPAAKPATGSTVTYKSLLTQTGNYECDYNQVQSSGQAKNVIYISNGKLRAEFRSTLNGVSNANIAVYDGHYLYEWQEGFTTGTRTTPTSLSQLPSAIPSDLTSGAIYGSSYESVGWICHPWSADPSLLVAPAYVTFS